MIPPPGCTPEPHIQRSRTGVRYRPHPAAAEKAIAQQHVVDLRFDWTQDESYNLKDTLPLNITVKRASLPLPIIIIGVSIVAIALFGYVRRRRPRQNETKQLIPNKPRDSDRALAES